MSVLMREAGCWVPIWFANWKLTRSLKTTTQFLAFLDPSFRCTTFGPYGSLGWEVFEMLICHECWWRIKCPLRTIFTWVAVAITSTLLTGKAVMGLPLSILCRNTLDDCVNMAQNNCPKIICEEQQWYPLQRLNSLPHCLLEITPAPHQGDPTLTAALKPIVVVMMPGVAETLRTVINTMAYGIDFRVVNMLETENPIHCHQDRNSSIEQQEYRFNIQLVTHCTLLSR